MYINYSYIYFQHNKLFILTIINIISILIYINILLTIILDEEENKKWKQKNSLLEDKVININILLDKRNVSIKELQARVII